MRRIAVLAAVISATGISVVETQSDPQASVAQGVLVGTTDSGVSALLIVLKHR